MKKATHRLSSQGAPLLIGSLVVGAAGLAFFVSSAFGSDGQDVEPTPAALATAIRPTSEPATAPDGRPRESTTYFTAPEVDQSVKDALADGAVTREEYERAVANTLACLDAKGVSHTEAIYDASRGQYSYQVMNASSIGDGLSPHDECWMRYERDIQSAWVGGGG